MIEDRGWIAMEEDGFIGLVGPLYHRPFANDGRGYFRFVPQEKHRNRAGIVHGGMIMTFADRSLGFTARHNDPGRAQVTVQMDVHFIRATLPGREVYMDCQILRETSALSFVEGFIHCDGETTATAKGIWKKLSPRRE